MDGTLIPIVEAPDAIDQDGNPVHRRTTRSSRFKEARERVGTLSARSSNQSLLPPWAPQMMQETNYGHCAIAAGMGANTLVHAVGDGAPWIANTVKALFGDSAT